VIDVSPLFPMPWTWAQANALTTKLAAKTLTGKDGSDLSLDAIGFRVTTTVRLPSAGSFGPTTMQPLPLIDTFDDTKLHYVSASEAPTSVSGGTITWANVGPLNAGARKTITVTFRALTAGDPITNTAAVTNAYFVSGRRTNDANSAANITVEQRGSIGDYVWWDLNANGLQDSGEPGLANVLVTLDNGARTRTAANGHYEFTGLINGTYTVTVNTSTLPWATFSQTKDPDATLNNASTVTINSAGTYLFTDRDFGYDSALNVITGTIFQDNNGDGQSLPTLQSGENPLAGLTVILSGSASATTTTDGNGFYRFGSLPNGTYTVTVTPPGSTIQTLDPDALDDNATTVTASGGNLYPNKDFAYKPTGDLTLGDSLYFDWNGNGAQDAGEGGIPGVDVFLYEDANGNGVIDGATDALIATAVTDPGGSYGFDSLVAGSYLVLVNTGDPQFPAGVSQTQDYDGVPDDRAEVSLTGSLANVDFGYQPVGTGSIGNLVWLDTDNDGLKDAAESGINGVAVQLYRAAQTPGADLPYAGTTTAGGGLYSFSSLPAGDWKIYLPAANFTGGGALAGTPLSSTTTVATDNPIDNDDNGIQAASGSAVTSPVITLAAAETDNTKDFGFVGVGSVGDFVFYDANGNGTQDYNETGIAGVTVRIFPDADANGVADGPTPVASAVTADGSGADPAGSYRFDNLTPGSYFVQVDTATLPAGLTFTSDPDLDGVPVNPPADPGDDADSHVRVTSGSNYSGADFGYQPPGAIGDLVWLDLNQDGIQSPGEPGIAGVAIHLTDGTTSSDLTTDFDGSWSAVLADGTWTISLPASNFGPGGALENRAATYDADGIGTPDTATITLAGGVVTAPLGLPQGNLGVDFGYKLDGSYSLSGTVAIHDTGVIGTADDVDDFFDDGADLDAGPDDETELAGVEVFLYTSGGDFLGSIFTDANGDYSFGGLASGSYKVIIGTTTHALKASFVTTTTGNNLNGFTVSSLPTSITQWAVIGAGSVADVDFTFDSDVHYDFGDLPASYGMTTLAQDGARHVIPSAGSTLYLGNAPLPDADTNGPPTALADGDDHFGSDDENGVVALSPATWTDGTAATGKGGDIQVAVTGSGWLVGWIDWNGDGDFLDTDPQGIGEMVVSQAVTTGTPTIGFDIPEGTIASGSQSWLSRFRLFPTEPAYPLFSYTGEATGGEVEDILLEKPEGGSIGDLVWRDLNAGGSADAGEEGLGGRMIELRNEANTLIATQTTGDGTRDVDGDGVIDPVGYYRFRGLGTGSYAVTVTNPPAGHNPSFDEDGTGTAHTTAVVLTAGTQHLSADFGYAPLTASISGQVRYDTDADGDPADTDPGALGIRIQLWSDPNGDGNPADGTQVGETFTDASGFYHFSAVPTGHFVVVETNASDATSTWDVAGANDDRIPLSVSGFDITGRDFLDTEPPVYAVSGTVYDDHDVTNDNVIGGDDTPVAGFTMALFLDRDGNGSVTAGDTLLASTMTNAAGAYGFANLTAGAYVVRKVNPAAAVNEWDAAGSLTDSEIAVVLTNTDITGRDFLVDAYLQPDLDSDDDGIPDAVETAGNCDGGGDTDGDGVPDILDLDSDGDGIFDLVEAGHGAPDADLDGRVDSAQGLNGLADALETAPDSGIPAYTPLNSDNDARPDHLDLDSDNDTISDLLESGNGGLVDLPAGGLLDGIADGAVNSDGIVPNAGQVPPVDADGDLTPDYRDLDSNGDGVHDITDNGYGPLDSTPADGMIDDAASADCDGIPDALDPKDDTYGWFPAMGCEAWNLGNADDTDGDVFPIDQEYAFGGDPQLGDHRVAGTTRRAGMAIARNGTAGVPGGAPGGVDISYVRPQGRFDVTVTLYVSDDPRILGNWTPVAAPPAITGNGDGTETLVWSNVHDLAGNPAVTRDRGFARLKVETPCRPDGSWTLVQGWCRQHITGKRQTYGVNFSSMPVFTGIVDSAAGSTVVTATSGKGQDLGAYLAGGGTCYLELTDGPSEGHRFNIASGGVDTFVLNLASANNTTSTLPADLAGSHFVVRRHDTLGGVYHNGEWDASDSPGSADQVLFYTGTGYTTYYNYSSGVWVRQGGGFTSRNALVIAPGTGMMVVHAGPADTNELLAIGDLRYNDFRRPVALGTTGLNFTALGHPFDATPASLGMMEADGFVSNDSPGSATQILNWLGDTTANANGWTTSFLYTPTSWRRVGNLSQVMNNATLFRHCRATHVDVQVDNPDWTHQLPWLPAPWTQPAP
jgi:hypothetical protein